ncbi:glycosyltransferase [Sulfitobacter sp. 1A10445]|uniref:glycosyltransferase n=1 Tax=unclassified Sulfitobacter TaxID=196795 RepID=UPI00374636E8
MDSYSTIFFVNGSSLGGGEVDSIIRASLMRGAISPLDDLAPSVVEFAKAMNVKIVGADSLPAYINGRNITVVLNGFLRDLTLFTKLLRWKLFGGRRLKIVLAVHSDPAGGLRRPSFKVRLALFLYEIFGRTLADRIRFMSERQLRTFPMLARSAAAYIDPPTSRITRGCCGLAITPSVSERKIDFLFIGRLSSSSFLGDAKNSDFIRDFSDYVEANGGNLTIIGGGSRTEVLNHLGCNLRTDLFSPRIDVTEVYRNAKVLLVPSLHEGYCLVVREAVLLGCHVLTTSAVAPELQTLANVTLLDSFDPEEWYLAARAVEA